MITSHDVSPEGLASEIFLFWEDANKKWSHKDDYFLYFWVWTFWNKFPGNFYEDFRLELTSWTKKHDYLRCLGWFIKVFTGFMPNLGMKAVKPYLLFGDLLLYSTFFLIPKSYMISVNKILKCPLGLIQLGEWLQYGTRGRLLGKQNRWS